MIRADISSTSVLEPPERQEDAINRTVTPWISRTFELQDPRCVRLVPMEGQNAPRSGIEPPWVSPPSGTQKLDATERREAESAVSDRRSGAEMASNYNVSQPTVSLVVLKSTGL